MAYRIAITSSDGEKIDLHFGQTKTFSIVEVDEETGEWRLLESRTAADDPSCGQSSGCAGSHERLTATAALLSGCQYLLTAKIGPKPQSFLQHAGITVLEAPPTLDAAIPPLTAYRRKAKIADT